MQKCAGGRGRKRERGREEEERREREKRIEEENEREEKERKIKREILPLVAQWEGYLEQYAQSSTLFSVPESLG